MIQNEKKNAVGRSSRGPCLLVIFDGFGYRKETDGNAIAAASMPMWQSLQKKYPHILLEAAGRAVGLPDGFIGNSEVGHLTIGAGRPIMTPLCKFHDSLDDGTFMKGSISELLREKLLRLKKKGKTLHLLGLLSDAGVHSHERHIHSLLQLAKKVGVKKTVVHAFLDGRDVLPSSAAVYLERLEKIFREEKYGMLGTVHGRFYAMDRDANWDRIKKSYDLLTQPPADEVDIDWRSVLDESYRQGVTDEFVEPILLSNGVVCQGDGLFFCNFRSDRMHQLTQAFLDPSFEHFKTCGLTPVDETLAFVFSTTRYKREFDLLQNDVLFEDDTVFHTLLDEIANQTKQRSLSERLVFLIAETEKYAHVTYFFRGKVDVELPHETRVLVPSVKAKTYVDHPKMSAPEITKRVVASLQASPAYFYLINYANCDMVGHSGDFAATVRACECLDEQLKILYDLVVEKLDGTIFLTADHGNAEEMVDAKTGEVKTAHTQKPVPFMVINSSLQGEYQEEAGEAAHGLASIAPTILQHLGLRVPKEMTGMPVKFK